MITTVFPVGTMTQSVTHRVENHLWVYFGVIFFPCGVQSGGDGSRKGSVISFQEHY